MMFQATLILTPFGSVLSMDTKLPGHTRRLRHKPSLFNYFFTGFGKTARGGFVAGLFTGGGCPAGALVVESGPIRAWKRGSSRRPAKRGSILAETRAFVPPTAAAWVRNLSASSLRPTDESSAARL